MIMAAADRREGGNDTNECEGYREWDVGGGYNDGRSGE